MKRSPAFITFSILSFVVPILIVLSNIGYYLGFADAAEFALVTKIASIAHAPGFPAYVVVGKCWSWSLGLFGIGHLKAIAWFSVFNTALASLIFYFTGLKIISFFYKEVSSLRKNSIAFFSAVSFSSGVTAWHWSGNVEVYTFHVMAFALVLWGLINFNLEKKKGGIYIAATGLVLGLANHHLTMILFLPFVLFFFNNNLFRAKKSDDPYQKKKSTNNKKSLEKNEDGIFKILSSQSFLTLTGLTIVGVIFFYGWMYIRAHADLPFKFGNPDSFNRLIYHLAGGAWIENTQAEVKGIIGLRFPYFMKLSFEQFFLFLPFIVAGIIECFRLGIRKLIIVAVGYYLLILLYQLRIDQTSDTDAYLLPAFFVSGLLLPFGITAFLSWNRFFVYSLPLFLGAQVIINFPKTDKRDFNVSETLMKEIDRSSPKGSVILIADWTTVIQYYYHRIAENFRTDLVVLNYDIKFTNYKILQALYPDFYKEIKPEYDYFIELLGKAHPQEIYNTGCTLDNPELMNSFLACITKMKSYCTKKQTAFMTDPKAYLFLMQYGQMNNTAKISGCFVSEIQTGLGKEFVNLKYNWLNSPLLMKEPSATDKMVDLEAMLDFSRNYYKATQQDTLYYKAEKSFERIKKLQRRMKKNMPFVYRPS